MSAPRRTIIVAVGDEILGGYTLDTNSHWLAQRLRDAGWPLLRIEVVADQREDIIDAVRRGTADRRAGRVLVCGGLGPTLDDITLEAVAAALHRPLEVHPDALVHVEGLIGRMHAAGWITEAVVSEPNRKMTMAPRGASVLFNRRGMAPGLMIELDPADGPDRWLGILPGVPREMEAIVAEEMIPRYFAGGTARRVSELRYSFAIEADFHEPMQTLARELPEISIGSYPQTETRELVIRIQGDDPRQQARAVERMSELRPGATIVTAAGADASQPAP